MKEPKVALMYIIITFMLAIDTPSGGMRLHTSPEDMMRAWVRGSSYAKLGANYGPSPRHVLVASIRFCGYTERILSTSRPELVISLSFGRERTVVRSSSQLLLMIS